MTEPDDESTYQLAGDRPDRSENVWVTPPLLGEIRRQTSKLRRFLTEHWEHEHETSLFLLVSLLDFFCTYLLLTTGPAGGQRFIESNPVAAWFLNHYGIVKGLLGFKLAMVLLVCCLSQAVSLSNVRLGRFILMFGILLTAGVVGYSIALLTRVV